MVDAVTESCDDGTYKYIGDQLASWPKSGGVAFPIRQISRGKFGSVDDRTYARQFKHSAAERQRDYSRWICNLRKNGEFKND